MKKVIGFLHDISNKLMAVAGNTGKLKNVKQENQKDAEYLEIISHNVDDLIEIVGALREYCTHQAATSDYKPYKMSDRISEFQNKIPKLESEYGIKIFLDVSECHEDVEVHSNPECAQRVSLNCIENAAKANASKVVFKYKTLETSVVVTITDDGDGMTEEELDKIGFGRYSTSGGGQGVSIIRDLVYETGGTVEYSSKKGFYTEVKIKLARAKNKLKLVA